MEDSPLHASNHPDRSSLGQRLQRRRVEPAGVINTQQLHCHDRATRGMAGRLIQRLALPERVKSRYGAGVLQPTATLQRLQRQRTESADVFDGEFRVTPHADTAQGATVQHSLQPQPRPFQNHQNQPGTHRPFRIDRQATVAAVNGRSSHEFHSRQRQVETHSNSNPAILQTQPETRSALLPTSPQASETFRIRRKATISAANASNLGARVEGQPKSHKHQDFPSARVARGVSSTPLSESVIQSQAVREFQPVQRQVETDSNSNPAIIQTQAVTLPNPSNPMARVRGASEPNPRQDLPLVKAARSFSTSSVQMKAEPAANPNRLVTGVEPTTEPRTNPPPVKGVIQRAEKHPDLPARVQGMIQTPAAETNAPSTVSTKPTPLSSPSELNRVWLKRTDGLQASEGQITQTPYSQQMSLPLAITRVSTNGAIARQTAVDNSTVQFAMPGNSTTPASSPETASASPIDIAAIAEQVSRILTRQLRVERERRGIKN